MLYFLVAGIYFQSSSPCQAQSSTPLMGARGQAMGNASVCLSDDWSILNNVAGLAEAKRGSVAMSYDALSGVKAFAKIGLALTLPGVVNAGIGLYRFGDAAYNEQLVIAGLATRWNHTALGMKVNYVRYAADGMGSRSVFSVSIGGITRLTPVITIGAHISNVNQPWLSRQFDERLPTTLTAGLLFTLTPEVIVVTEIEKRINDMATGRAGLEFGLHHKFTGRLGCQLYPHALTGGVGFKLRYFVADYSALYSQLLGTRHQATLAYKWAGVTNGTKQK